MSKEAIDHYFRADICNRCIQILSGRLPPKLLVKVGGHAVSVSGLGKIADAIRKGRIRVGYFNANKPYVDEKGYAHYPPGYVDMDPGRMASYHISSNELWITRPPSKVQYEAMVVPEATHALYDLHDWDSSTRVAEAAAHIAEGWYLWFHGFTADKGIREGLMIHAAKIVATASVPSRREKYRAKYPKDWKQRLTKRLTAAYEALVNDLKSSYKLGDPVEFDGL